MSRREIIKREKGGKITNHGMDDPWRKDDLAQAGRSILGRNFPRRASQWEIVGDERRG